MKLVEELGSLHGLELYEELLFLFEFADPQPNDLSSLSTKNQLLLWLYVADAYTHTLQFKQSIKYFAKALPLYEKLPKDLTKSFAQVEVRYRYCKALMRLRNYTQALEVLRGIQLQTAPAKVKYALQKLLTVHLGDRQANDTQLLLNETGSNLFLELLFVQMRRGNSLPHSLLTQLNSRIHTINCNNLKMWLNVNTEIMNRNHTEGIRQMLGLQAHGHRVFREMAEVYYLMGMKNECHDAFKSAHSSEQDRPDRMGLYARILRQMMQGEVVRLNLRIDALSSSLRKADPDSPDLWLAYGEFAIAKRENSKAMHFATKAEGLSTDTFTRSLARLLKANIFVNMNKFGDAEKMLRAAILEDPSNFSLYEPLVDAIMNQKKKYSISRALTVVDTCLDRLPDDPQAKTLNVMLKLRTKRRATKAHDELLEKLEVLMNEYPYIKEIPLTLMEEYKKAQQFDRAKDIMKRSSQNWLLPNEAYSQIQEKLAELATTKGDPEEAYDRVMSLADTPNLSDQMNALENRFRTPTNPSRRAPRLPRAGRPRGALLQPLPPDSMDTP